MQFAWDPSKSEANLRDRGFDFAFATLNFDGPTVEVEDRRRDYGERRMVVMGLADGWNLTVVYTDRVYTDRTAEGRIVRRIVSARRSSCRERQIYNEATEQG